MPLLATSSSQNGSRQLRKVDWRNWRLKALDFLVKHVAIIGDWPGLPRVLGVWP
jgi:hypothetical protein